jgi:hypothetical protein
MRTLTLKLTAAITGRRVKPPMPDEELAALKEQARQLLQAPTLTPDDTAPAPAPAPPRPTPQWFGSHRTDEPRNETPPPNRTASGWDMAWARLTATEKAWSSQP